jgi:hypothetical protein
MRFEAFERMLASGLASNDWLESQSKTLLELEKRFLHSEKRLLYGEAAITLSVLRNPAKIGWEGEKNPNHFQLFEQIYTNEFHITKEEVRELLDPTVLERMITEVRQNFQPLMSVNRVTLICKCLEYRFNELRKLL